LANKAYLDIKKGISLAKTQSKRVKDGEGDREIASGCSGDQ
jgi:hypothetical protein